MKCVIAMVFLGVGGYYIFSNSNPSASLTHKNFCFSPMLSYFKAFG